MRARRGRISTRLHLYLPLAQGLVEHGARFFLDAQSIHAPPFSYIYAAMLGGSPPLIKAVDGVLSGATLLLVFRTASLLHSRLAGLLAAFLFAASPLTRPWLAAPITEAPYLLLCAAWIWGVAEYLEAGKRWALWLAALAVSLACLTRATMFYWIPLLAVVSGALGLGSSARAREWRDVSLAHIAALALPTAFIAKNWLVFGFPFFTTGGGNALYLGNNPVTGGYDPNYLGLYYDVGSITRDFHHLSLEGERLLSRVARFVISQQSLHALVVMHVKKLAAFIFVTNAEEHVEIVRSWRIATIVLAAVGFRFARPRPLAWLVLGMLAYQVAIHVPVLYTHRYSVGAMDLWLILLAGVGVAGILRSRRRAVLALGTLTVVAAGAAAGVYAYSHAGPPHPDVFAAPRHRVWQGRGFVLRVPPNQRAAIDIPVRGTSPMYSWANYILVLDAKLESTSGQPRCAEPEVAYRPDGEASFHGPVEIRVPVDGVGHRIQLGSVPLELDAPGTLRVTLSCETAAVLEIPRAAVYMPLGSIVARELVLHEPHMFPYEP